MLHAIKNTQHITPQHRKFRVWLRRPNSKQVHSRINLSMYQIARCYNLTINMHVLYTLQFGTLFSLHKPCREQPCLVSLLVLIFLFLQCDYQVAGIPAHGQNCKLLRGKSWYFLIGVPRHSAWHMVKYKYMRLKILFLRWIREINSTTF